MKYLPGAKTKIKFGKIGFRAFLIVLIAAAFAAPRAVAQDIPSFLPQNDLSNFKKTAPVVVKGDKVAYNQAEKKIVASGHIYATYEDVVLTCDNIIVYMDTKIGICKGNVIIVQKGKYFSGEEIEYNFGQKTGKIVDGYVKASPIYGFAQNLSKTSDKLVKMQKGYVTTCDLDKPHYRITAREVEFYIDEKVVARDVIFYIGDIPVFYVPYFVQPIVDSKTKISVIPGYSDDWGYYVLGSYRYYFSETMKGYLRLDYRHKKGLGEGIDNNFSLGAIGEGLLRYYYTQENNMLAASPSGDVRDRYRIQYKHSIDFTEDTKGMLELNKTSDEDFIKDYFFKELDDGWTPDNYLSIVTAKPNYGFEVLARKQLDKFVTVTEKLPELTLHVYNQRLWDTQFYYYNDARFTNFKKVYAESLVRDDEESLRMDTYHRVSYAAKLFGFLYATPYVGTRQTYYSKNAWGDDNQFRQVYEYGIDFSTQFYKRFSVHDETWDINDIRHVIAPSIGFKHRHQPTIAAENLLQFDDIDAIERDNRFTFSLENKLQTKRGEPGQMQSVDLVRFIVSTEYEFNLKKGQIFDSKGDGKFLPILYDLEIKPFDWMFAKTEITMNVKKNSFSDCIESANTDLVLDLGEKFDIGLGHRYENTSNGSASQFTTELNYRFNKDWAFRVYERFDAHAKKWDEQEYTIFKDLHCWQAEFTINMRESDFVFWVVFRLKAFPELPIGFRRTYRRPSPGAGTGVE